LWEHGSIVDLNTLIDPGASLYLAAAAFLNDRGEIVGDGLLANGDNRAFLLIPCDDKHPGVEGCDYSMVEAPAAVRQTSSTVRNPSSRPLPQSLMRWINRYRFPGRAFGPSNSATP
jgi:hypothetical protein